MANLDVFMETIETIETMETMETIGHLDEVEPDGGHTPHSVFPTSSFPSSSPFGVWRRDAWRHFMPQCGTGRADHVGLLRLASPELAPVSGGGARTGATA